MNPLTEYVKEEDLVGAYMKHQWIYHIILHSIPYHYVYR
jgi:hypothetical protein